MARRRCSCGAGGREIECSRMELWGANAKFGWSDGMERGGRDDDGSEVQSWFRGSRGLAWGRVWVSVLQATSRVGGRGIWLGRLNGRDEAADNLFKKLLKFWPGSYCQCNIILRNIYSFCAQL
jgi:hypothetical protein